MWHTLRIKYNLHVPTVVVARLVCEIDPVCFYAKKTKTVDQEAVPFLWPKFLLARGW